MVIYCSSIAHPPLVTARDTDNGRYRASTAVENYGSIKTHDGRVEQSGN